MLDITRAYGLDFYFPAGDDTVGAHLRRYGEFARPEVDVLLAYATGKGGAFIDVGANIGAVALPFAKARPDWRVLAIEAHRGLAGVLAANVYGNQLYGVEPIHAAAGAKSQLIDFATPQLSARGNFGILSVHSKGEATEQVRMLRLDDIAPADTRVVKIDVEGYETEVMAGAKALLARKETVWLAEASDQHAEASERLLETFISAGYAVHWFFAPFVTPNSEKSRPEIVRNGDVNLVALPPGVENLWNLPSATPGSPRPTSAFAYTYLPRYGFPAPPS